MRRIPVSDQPTNAEQPFGIDETPAPVPAGAPSENDKLMAGLCYISQFLVPVVLPLILLLSEDSKRNQFLRYHAVTSLGLLGAAVVFEILALVINVVLVVLACVLWILFLVPIVPFVYYGIKAFQGQTFEVPYLTKFLKQQNWL
jgi:uncharacterized membrane protein